ncbi:MAG TPA: MazG family protein, partial [Armatimonadota bacterium]
MPAVLTLLGLGAGSPEGISLAALRALRSSRHVWLRTRIHPTVALLQEEGIGFHTFDEVYEKAESLDVVYPAIVARLLALVETGEPVVYAVPGHPLVAERTTELLLEAARDRGLQYQVLSSGSFIDACLQAMERPLPDGLQVLDAQALPEGTPDPGLPALFYQVDHPLVASDLKIRLLDRYPESAEVVVIRAAGVPGEQKLLQVPLVELDRQEVDHLTSVYVPEVPVTARKPDFPDLVEIVRRLRAPDGCPWDREQTHASLRKYLLEESYEAIEAIDLKDDARLCDELGDVLLQVMLHSQMASEEDSFTIREVIEAITTKMIRRHPHVFGDVEVADSQEVLHNWERIKAKEKGAYSERKSVLDGVP